MIICYFNPFLIFSRKGDVDRCLTIDSIRFGAVSLREFQSRIVSRGCEQTAVCWCWHAAVA